MVLKKSDLYSLIWSGCDALRGGMDASQYKDYVLILLFVKYVSDKFTASSDGLIEVPEGGSFADMVALKGQKDIGDKMNKIIAKLAEANDLRGVIDVADFNDSAKLGEGKEMQDRLSALIDVFNRPALNFSNNRANNDDLLGDAYEYLMRKFATESGKSKGQFYTPSEVSQVMAKIIGISKADRRDRSIYDPTCGSGSLLLKAADESESGVTIYGQEMDNATSALAKMNMILHNNPTAEIWQGNTLAKPHWTVNGTQLKTFDYVVANPPFSTKAWTTGVNVTSDPFNRFKIGDYLAIPPEKNGDYAFLLHVIGSLKSTGKGAVILPHGVLFRGNVEADIRTRIIQHGYIKGIIGLPANLFYGTGIPAVIIVLDKEEASKRDSIFMIDASNGFVKDGNKNRLRYQDIHKIVDVFNNQIEVPRYSRRVPYEEIQQNDYNLNIPRYIDSTEPEDIQDIEAHLNGGIPNRDIDALERYWSVFPSIAKELFKPNAREGYSDLRVEHSQIRSTIFQHPEFKQYAQQVSQVFAGWADHNRPKLERIQTGDNPKDLIGEIAEDLLECFEEVPLLDEYDVYQHLMTYWGNVMQDDVYLVVATNWVEANTLRKLVKQGKSYVEEHDFELNKARFKADLIPPQLVIQRYFSDQQTQLDSLKAELDTAVAGMAELEEEHGGEDGLLSEVTNDKGNVTKGAVKSRLKALNANDPDDADEFAVLTQYAEFVETESSLKKQIKDAEATLYTALINRYPQLTENEVLELIVIDKWLTTLQTEVQGELDRVSVTLANRIGELAERYATPLPKIEARVAETSARVAEHLKRMGYTWTT